MNKTTDDGDEKRPHKAPLAYTPEPVPAPVEDDKDKSGDTDTDKSADEGDGEQGEGDGGGGGGGPSFEETEHDFDEAELQGLSLPIFRRALKKGLQLASRVTKQVERDLRNFLPGGLHARVMELSFSKKGHPTLLLDKGEIVQYQMSKGKLERVRVTPDLEAERAVRYAMAGFIAAGESIDPKHVKFGRTPHFEARMKPIWTREYHRILQQENDAHMGMRLKDVRFAIGSAAKPKAARMPAWLAGKKPPAAAIPLTDLPRGGNQGQTHRPGL